MKQIQNLQDIPIPEGMEQRLSQLVDRLEREERARKRIPLRRALLAAAAILAFAFILIGVHNFTNDTNHEAHITEVTDPEEARRQTERALLALAATMNKGLNSVETAGRHTAHVNAVVQQALTPK